MDKSPYTWDGTAINDGTNYVAYFPTGQTLTASGSGRWTPTASTYPYLSGVELSGGLLTMIVEVKGTVSSQQETVKRLFDVNNRTPKKLIIKDTTDSSRQWYVYARPLNVLRNEVSPGFTVPLALVSPIWLTESSITETTWAITATGQQKTVTINKGNLSAYPVISISPNAARGAGFAYKRFITTYNRTTAAASYYNIDITAGGLNTTGLVSDTAVSNQINSLTGITDSATTIPIDTAVGGGLPASGMGYIVDGANSEQISWAGNSGGNLTGVTRGLGGTTPAAHADNVVITLSHMLANGSDIRVRVGTTEGNMTDNQFWLSTTALAAATALKIWTPITYGPRVICNTAASMTNSQTTVTHTVVSPVPNFPTTGGTLLIESEVMTYTSYDPVLRKFSGLVRGAFGTTAATHTANQVVNLIPVIMMFYGDASLTMPAYNTQYKPVFTLTSTNSAHTYDDFRVVDDGVLRAGGWKYKVKNIDQVSVYDTTQTLDSGLSDTSAAIGVTLQNAYMNGYWQLAEPFGFTSAVFSNISRYNIGTNTSGIRFAQIRSYLSSPTVFLRTDIAATTLANTWQLTASLTHTPTSVHKFLQLYLFNSSASPFANPAAVDARSVVVNLSTSTTSTTYGVPYVGFGAEQTIEYSTDLTLTNTTTGKAIQIKTEIPFGQSISVDTLNKTVTRSWDGRSAFSDFALSDVREQWLELLQGNNVLQYDETGASGIDVIVTWQGRNN